MGNIYKSKESSLKDDPYIWVQTKALIHASHRQGKTRGVNRNKRNGYKLLILVSIE